MQKPDKSGLEPFLFYAKKHTKPMLNENLLLRAQLLRNNIRKRKRNITLKPLKGERLLLNALNKEDGPFSAEERNTAMSCLMEHDARLYSFKIKAHFIKDDTISVLTYISKEAIRYNMRGEELCAYVKEANILDAQELISLPYFINREVLKELIFACRIREKQASIMRIKQLILLIRGYETLEEQLLKTSLSYNALCDIEVFKKLEPESRRLVLLRVAQLAKKSKLSEAKVIKAVSRYKKDLACFTVEDKLYELNNTLGIRKNRFSKRLVTRAAMAASIVISLLITVPISHIILRIICVPLFFVSVFKVLYELIMPKLFIKKGRVLIVENAPSAELVQPENTRPTLRGKRLVSSVTELYKPKEVFSACGYTDETLFSCVLSGYFKIESPLKDKAQYLSVYRNPGGQGVLYLHEEVLVYSEVKDITAFCSALRKRIRGDIGLTGALTAAYPITSLALLLLSAFGEGSGESALILAAAILPAPALAWLSFNRRIDELLALKGRQVSAKELKGVFRSTLLSGVYELLLLPVISHCVLLKTGKSRLICALPLIIFAVISALLFLLKGKYVFSAAVFITNLAAFIMAVLTNR